MSSVNFDHNRRERTGLDEVILAEPKQDRDLKEALLQSLKRNNKVLITRIQQNQIEIIAETVKTNNFDIIWDGYKRTCIVGENEEHNEQTSHLPVESKEAKVAILSGGTSDQPIVEEIIMSLHYFGIPATSFPDVGVAGIHRHQEVLDKIANISEIKVIIVVAGNEGALFSVVSGQTKLPMIAVPASIGYGFGGKGLTALQSALQSCSPGVVTVNIDNGFGAAAFVRKLLHS